MTETTPTYTMQMVVNDTKDKLETIVCNLAYRAWSHSLIVSPLPTIPPTATLLKELRLSDVKEVFVGALKWKGRQHFPQLEKLPCLTLQTSDEEVTFIAESLLERNEFLKSFSKILRQEGRPIEKKEYAIETVLSNYKIQDRVWIMAPSDGDVAEGFVFRVAPKEGALYVKIVHGLADGVIRTGDAICLKRAVDEFQSVFLESSLRSTSTASPVRIFKWGDDCGAQPTSSTA